MIDRRYGHLARDGRQHAIALLDTLSATARGDDVHAVDARVDAQQGIAHGSQPENPSISRTIP